MSQERSVKDLSGLYNFDFGGADGIRTHDLLDAIEARSQLRHAPTGGTTAFMLAFARVLRLCRGGMETWKEETRCATARGG